MDTIKDQIKAYLSDGKFSGGRKRAGWSPKHLEKKELHLNFWVTKMNLVTLKDLTHLKFRLQLADMVESGKTTKTASNYAEAMTSFLKWLVDMDVIEENENPLRRFKTWSQKVSIKTGYYTRDEFDRMMIHADREFKLVCLVAVYTGLRRGELSALQVKCLKEYEGTYWLCLDGEHCKSGKDARQPIPYGLAQILMKKSKGKAPEAPLLCVVTHTNRTIDILMRKAGVVKYPEPKIRRTFHSLRDSYITWMAHGGVDIKTVQELARHSTMELTARYMHTYDERKCLAIAKINIFKDYMPKTRGRIGSTV